MFRRWPALALFVLLAARSAPAQTAAPHPILLAAAAEAAPARIPPEWHLATAKAPAFFLVPGKRPPAEAALLAKAAGVPLAAATETPASAAQAGRGLISIAEPSIQGDSARVGVLWLAPGWLKDLKDRPVQSRTCVLVFGQSGGKWALARSLCQAG